MSREKLRTKKKNDMNYKKVTIREFICRLVLDILQKKMKRTSPPLSYFLNKKKGRGSGDCIGCGGNFKN